MTKTNLPYKQLLVICDLLVTHHPPEQASDTRGHSDRIWFSSRFSTIWAKIQVLKLIICKITVILRRKSPFLATSPVVTKPK
jgi:hypothetical protein